MSSNNAVKCAVGCNEFGPDSGFLLDPKLIYRCKEFDYNKPDSQKCDLMCRDRSIAPVVKETQQKLKQVICDKVCDVM